MSIQYEKFQKRRLLSSYFSVVVSIFLVLFLLGLLGFFVLNSRKLADNFKEQIVMTVFLNNLETQNDTLNSQNFAAELKAANYIRNCKYMTKEDAAKQHTDIIGEDFLTFLGENPLQNSYDIHLKAKYIDAKNIAAIENKFRSNPVVSDIVYDKQLVSLVNDNIRIVSLWILGISLFLSIIAILLINSSIRLSIYSNRFIIKTMQMVGATKAFIQKPFIIRNISLGLLGGLLAVISLLIVLFSIDNNYPNLNVFSDILQITLVLLSVLFTGVLITLISTFFATRRFLNLRTDDLY